MLINCPECNHEVSDKAHACPNCGHLNKQEEPVCDFCQGTGVFPKHRRIFWNYRFPFVSILKYGLLGAFAKIGFDSIFGESLFSEVLIPIVSIIVMISIVELAYLKQCPKCNGTGSTKNYYN